MDQKKDLKPQPAMQSQLSQNKASATSSPQATTTPYAQSRSSMPKAVPELTRELAMTMFMLNRLEASGKPFPQEQSDKAKALITELKAANIEFYGLIGKCMISGNDCHLLDAKLDIVEHFSKNQNVPENFEAARHLIPTLPAQAVCLMVYSHQIECLYTDGSTQVLEKL